MYGLAADASNPSAVARIFAAKGRPADHPLIVHIGDIAQLAKWAREIPQAAYTLAERYWPGPLTMILKRQAGVSDVVTGGQDSVGVRMPKHALTLSLLKAFAEIGSGAVAAPSANKFGRISPTRASHVKDDLGNEVAMILDGGECEVGIESTIIDLSRDVPVVLRPGAITLEEIEALLGQHADAQTSTKNITPAPRVSGALAAHYAPRTPLQLVASGALLAQVDAYVRKGKRLAVLAFHVSPLHHDDTVRWFAAAHSAPHYARDLYANLRLLDASGADCILVEAPPATEAWHAVVDRLGRAAVGSGVDDMQEAT